MTDREKVLCFDDKIVHLEEKRNSGMGAANLGLIMTNIFAFFFMLIPIHEMVQAVGVFWMILQGILLYLGGYFRMQWLLVLAAGGKQVSWKKFLQYAPVNWKEYRRHRYRILLGYTGKMFLCFFVLQWLSQLLSGTLIKSGYRWSGLAYVAGMCFCWLLVPGILQIRRRG